MEQSKPDFTSIVCWELEDFLPFDALKRLQPKTMQDFQGLQASWKALQNAFEWVIFWAYTPVPAGTAIRWGCREPAWAEPYSRFRACM